MRLGQTARAFLKAHAAVDKYDNGEESLSGPTACGEAPMSSVWQHRQSGDEAVALRAA